MSRLAVVYGKLFLEAAQLTFPPERGSAYSGPTFGEFMNQPVRAAKLKFSRDWDDLPDDYDGLVRTVLLGATGAFNPLAFYGLLITRNQGVAVEIASFDYDDGYWTTFGDDTLD